jgi:hypothetical protein
MNTADAGANGFLVKPVGPKELDRCVKQEFPAARLGQQALRVADMMGKTCIGIGVTYRPNTYLFLALKKSCGW